MGISLFNKSCHTNKRCNGDNTSSPIARFKPTDEGWWMAIKLAERL